MSPKASRRFALSVLFGLVWFGLSLWIAQPWIHDLAGAIGTLPAWGVVLGLALLPGYMNAQLLAAVLLDPTPALTDPPDWPDLTVVVAAYDEEARIAETLSALQDSRYPGELRFLVADDGSNDGTAELVSAIAAQDPRVRLLALPHGGKAAALNAALDVVATPVMATVDADTLVTPEALRRAVARLGTSQGAVAVAGSLLVRNQQADMLTRVQEWDYAVGIASVKRAQAAAQGTLVAQGAFSVYRSDAVRAAGGWPDVVGEDIVLTWAMLRDGGHVGYEPTAVAYTEVPTRLMHFIRQRRRWARGMIEGLRAHGGSLLRARRAWAHGIWVDQFLPFLDAVYTLAMPLGIGLALTGRFWILGPMTLAVVPVNLAIGAVLVHRQRRALGRAGLSLDIGSRDLFGLAGFIGLYQLVVAPVSLSGYVAEVVRARRSW